MPPQQSAVVVRRRSLDTIALWALLATLVVAVFAFIPSSAIPLGATKAFVLAAGALITLALFILARLSRGNIILPPLVLVGAFWLPVVAYALSATFSSAPFASALWGSSLNPDTLGFMLIAAILATVTALAIRRTEHYRLFLSAVGGIFGVVALLQVLILVVGQFAPATIPPAFSVLGSLNDLAFLLGLGVVLALITLRFLELPRRVHRGLIIAGILALGLLAVLNSTLVWILVAIISLGLFVEAVMQRGGRPTDTDLDEVRVMDEGPVESDAGNHSLVLPLAVLAISLFFLIGGTLGSALADSLHVNVLSVRPSWQSTFVVAKQVYTTSPIFGTGPGSFGANWLKYRDASLNSTVFWNIDFSSGIGFIPTSLATLGLLGAVAWLGFLVLLLVFGFRMLVLRAPQDAFVRYTAILSFIALAYLFVAMTFDLPGPVILVLAFVFAGLFASTTRFAERGAQWGIVFARSPRLGFVIVFSLTLLLLSSVVAGYALAERYLATIEFARAQTAFSANDLDASDKAAQSSIAFAPDATVYQLQAGIANVRLTQIVNSSTIGAAAAQQQFQAALSSGINAALTATRLAPSDYRNWVALGNLYAQAVPLNVSGAYESAKTAYDKARELNPTNPQIPYIQAQLDIAHKDGNAAKADLKAAIALKQDYVAAIFLLSQLEVAEGNVKDALASALAAAYFTPNDPSILFQVGVLRAASGDFGGAVQALEAAVTASPQFANARYFLAAVYARQGDLPRALAQLQAVASFSSENEKVVAPLITALEAGKNPFPANLLSAPPSPVRP